MVCCLLVYINPHVFLGQGEQKDVKQGPAPRMPIRRNLCVFLPPESPRTVARAQAFEEGMFPLQCTPEPTQKTLQASAVGSTSAMDPNMTFEVLDNDDQTGTNATVIISTSSPCPTSASADLSGPSQPLCPPKANEGNQIPVKR